MALFDIFGAFSNVSATKDAKRQVKQGFRDQVGIAAPQLQLQRNALAAIASALGLPAFDLEGSTGQARGNVPGISPALARALGSSGMGFEGSTTGSGTGLDFLMNLPFLQRERDEATKLFENSAAARGGLLSGSAINESRNRIQELTRGQFGSALQMLMSAAGLGGPGTAAAGAAAGKRASNLANLELQEGAARSSAFGAIGDTVNELLSAVGNVAGMGGFGGGGTPLPGISGGGGGFGGGAPINLLPQSQSARLASGLY